MYVARCITYLEKVDDAPPRQYSTTAFQFQYGPLILGLISFLLLVHNL